MTAHTGIFVLVRSSKSSSQQTTILPVVGRQDNLDGLLNGPNLGDRLLGLPHVGDLLVYLGEDIGQDKLSTGACLLLAHLVCAVLVGAMVHHATVEACPGQVGPELGVFLEVGGDGNGDGRLLAVVCPGHGVSCGKVVRVVFLAQVHPVGQLLFMQQDIIEK